MTSTKSIKTAKAHLKMLAFTIRDEEKPNLYTNIITEESILYKPQYDEYQPHNCDYTQRMHDICKTLNTLL